MAPSKVKKSALKGKHEAKKTVKEVIEKKKRSDGKSEKGKVNEVKSKAGSKDSKRKIEEPKAKETKDVKRAKEVKDPKTQQKPKINKEVPEEKRVPALKDSKKPAAPAPTRRVSVKSSQKQTFHPDDPPASIKGAKLLTPPTKPPMVTPSPSPRGSSTSLRELKDLSKTEGYVS